MGNCTGAHLFRYYARTKLVVLQSFSNADLMFQGRRRFNEWIPPYYARGMYFDAIWNMGLNFLRAIKPATSFVSIVDKIDESQWTNRHSVRGVLST